MYYRQCALLMMRCKSVSNTNIRSRVEFEQVWWFPSRIEECYGLEADYLLVSKPVSIGSILLQTGGQWFYSKQIGIRRQ